MISNWKILLFANNNIENFKKKKKHFHMIKRLK